MKKLCTGQFNIHLLCIMFFLGSTLCARPSGNSNNTINGGNVCPEAIAGGPYTGSCLIQLSGSINLNGGPPATSLWVSNTGGTFANPNSLSTTYIPSALDIANGSVTLVLMANSTGNPVGCFPSPSSSSVTISLTSLNDQNSCTDDGCTTSGTIRHTPVNGGNPPATAGQVSGPGSITGTLPGTVTISVCSPGTYQYCVPPIAGATSYVWWIDHTTNPSITFPGGLTTITTTYNCVDVIIPAGYNSSQELEVRGVNCFGNGSHSEADIKLISPDDNNPCTTDACNSGIISHTPLTNLGGGASDNNLCTNDNCLSGQTIHPAIATDDGNPCTADVCNSLTGSITHDALTPAQLSDGNACTTDACTQAGGITHTALTAAQLNDGNECTTDGCNTLTGPTHIPLTAAQLNDGNACTVDACNSASGPTHTALTTAQLDDVNPCTTDGCNTATGPTHIALTTAQMTDGNACTTDACNSITGVTHTPLTTAQLNDGNECTVDGCNTATGPTHVAFTAAQLNDDNACTTDACNTTTGPTHTALTTAQLTDGNACTIDACNTASGPTHTALTTAQLDDVNPCTTDGCNTATGPTHIALTTAQMTDGNACTTDACNSIAGVTHTPLTTAQLNDGNECTVDGCNTATGPTHVAFTAAQLNDGNECTTDGCNTLTGPTHIPLTAAQLNDGNACTVDACNSASGPTHTALTTAQLDDVNPCTTDGCNTATGPTHIALTTAQMTDGNACTTDACNSITGVTHTPLTTAQLNDGNECTVDGCNTATGPTHVAFTAAQLNDDNACTTDACNTTTGPTHTALTTAQLTDGNACTIDACNTASGPTHTALTTAQLDDVNPCTTDGCNTATGPTHIALTTAQMTDGNACTTDACNSIAGVTHTALTTVQIDDGNVCTTDGCETIAGIFHTPLTNSGGGASDNNLCTDDNCVNGQTVHLPIGNGNPPATAGQITGPGIITGALPGTVTISVCSPGTYQYCVPVIAGATSYVWWIDHTTNPSMTFPGGLTTITTTYNCVDVIIPAGYNSSQELEVRGVNCNGNGHHSEVNIKLISTDDNNPCTIDVCNSENIVTHIAVSNGSPGATDNNSCTSDVCQSGQTIHIATNIDDGDNCTIDACNPANGSVTHTYIGNSAPPKPGAITGPGSISSSAVTVCSPGTFQFCVPIVPGAASYNWTIDHSANPSLSFSSSSIVTSITTTYNCVDVTIPSGYNSSQELEVRAVSCNNVVSQKREIDVKLVSTLATPGNISGSSSVCLSQTKTYSISIVPGATIYVWSATNNAQIISGQGTTSIQVNFSTANSNGVVLSVYAATTTGCSNSLIRTKNINVNLNCRTSDAIAEESQDISMNEISVFPNPTSGKATLKIISMFDCSYNVKVMNILGKVIIDEDMTVLEGLNTKDVNLENIESGVYFISIRSTNSQMKTLRIIVE